MNYITDPHTCMYTSFMNENDFSPPMILNVAIKYGITEWQQTYHRNLQTLPVRL